MRRTQEFAIKYSSVCFVLAFCSCAVDGGDAGSTPPLADASQRAAGATGLMSAGSVAPVNSGSAGSPVAGAGGYQGITDAGGLDPATLRPDAGITKPDATVVMPDASVGTALKAGNPDGKCSQALPAQARPADSSHPTTVVGTGNAASCSSDKLAAAIAQGGVITFDCGTAPATIGLTASLELRTDRDTVIDGGNKITLDGGDKVRLLSWNSADWQKNTHTLTLQHLVLAHGRASGTKLIPMHPEPCSQGYNDGEGGALLMRDGSLRAIDVTFANNQAAELGPDTGGGAIYLLGSLPAYIVSCTFSNNKASNAGAMGSLFTTDFIYDSLFENNSAVGHGANNNDPSMCSFMNNGQNEVGSGGNGGAIYSDGVAMDVTICGTQLRNNTAGAFGAAVFFTSNDQSKKGTLNIRDSIVSKNMPATAGWEWKPGISTNANTPEPISSDIRR